MEQILKALQEMEQRVNKKFDSMDAKFDTMTKQLDRMEETLNNITQTANGDTVTILERIDRNTKNLNQDIEFLSEQVGKHELFFNRMNKN